MGKGHLSLGKTILTVEPGRGGEASYVSRKTVKPGRGGEGSSVSRNNDSNCRTREKEKGESFVSRNNDSNCRTRKREGRGHLSILGGEGRGHLCLFKCRTRETGVICL